jgi:WD40 repeat protein
LSLGRFRGVLLFVALGAGLLLAPATASAVNPVSFSSVGNLTVPRQNAGAALLPDGKALVVGGYDGSQDLSSTELFDPKTKTFSFGPSMAVGRYAPAVAGLPDGRVLVAGGANGNDALTSAEVFNPSTGSFSPVGSLTTGRMEARAAPLPDGRVLVLGGYDGENAVASTEIFDPKTNSFGAGPNLPRALYDPGVAVISGGRVLIAGGYDDTVPESNLKDAYVFDPASGTFSATAPLPGLTYAPSGASLPDGRALIAGGYDDDIGDYLTRAVAFDPAANGFTSNGIGPLIHKREEGAAVELADGRVLVAGGYDSPNRLESAEILSVPSNSFKSKLKGRKVKLNVSTEGVGQVTDVSTKVATTAKKKKKPKLVKTSSKHGGPGTIVVKIKLTKQGNAKLRQKGKLKVRVVYTPDGGVAATKKLKLRAGK